MAALGHHTHVLKSPFDKFTALKASYLLKRDSNTGVYCEIFENTYFEKQVQTAASVHSASKLEK